MSSEGLSMALAGHVACFPAGGLHPATLHAAKRALLDGVGVMIAASGQSADVAPFIDYAARSHGPASILGCAIRTSPEMAAFANGAMAHALDFEDAFDPAPSHPNASLLPAVLAIAQGGPSVSGYDLLAAIAIGCDLVCRLGLSLRRPMEAGGWYPPPILGAFGAVAAAARLRRLDATQVRDAFSLMLCQATMPGEIKHSRHTVIRAVREAFPAQAAVQVSALARAGVRGFEAPFEGEGGFFRLYANGQYDPACLLDRLGEHFWIEQLTFKRWPACRGTHAYIEAAQILRARYGLRPEGIRAIVATGSEVQQMLVEPAVRKVAPATAIDAKFSIPFTIATALIDPEVTLDSFGIAALTDPAKRALAGKVRFEQQPGWGRERASAGGLSIELEDGRQLVEEVANGLGDVARPLGDAALTTKFRDCVARARCPPPHDAITAFAGAIWTIDTADDVAAALERYIA